LSMSVGKLRQIAVLASALLMAGFVLPVATRAANKHGADLVAHVKIEHLGTPPHILVGASGSAPRFTVVVTTENQGDVASVRSKTALTIKSGALTRVYQWRVGVLGTRERSAHSVLVENLEPDLGFTVVTGKADYHRTVRETDERNNEQKKEIAVEPREWDVSDWATEDVGQGTDNVTQAGQGFYLRFQKYDHGFVYQAYGSVTDTPKRYPGCTALSGSKTVTQTPWANSVLKIDPDLKTYDAFVDIPPNNFFATCNVATTSFQIQVAFLGLSTSKASTPKKDPDDTELQGVDQMSTAVGTQGWAWTFKAHLPKR
jgi:hypothetical protein